MRRFHALIRRMGTSPGAKDAVIHRMGTSLGAKDAVIHRMGTSLGARDAVIRRMGTSLGARDAVIHRMGTSIGAADARIRGIVIAMRKYSSAFGPSSGLPQQKEARGPRLVPVLEPRMLGKEVIGMTNNSNSKNGKATAMTQVIAGARKNFPNGSQVITLDGTSTTIDAVMNEFQAFITNRGAIVAAQTAARNKVAAEDTGMTVVDALLGAFIAFVRQTFGASSTVLADFAIPVRKAPVAQTAEQKAVAAAKRKATRVARGTTGPKAKKAIKGSVTASLVVTSATAVDATGTGTTPAPAPTAAAPGGTPATPARA